MRGVDYQLVRRPAFGCQSCKDAVKDTHPAPADQRLTNVIVATGDAHRHLAGDLISDDSDRPVASEYLATSVTSGGDGRDIEDPFTRSVRLGTNDFLKSLVDRRGYVLCDVTRGLWRGELKVMDSVGTPNAPLRNHAVFVTEHGKVGLVRRDT